MFWPLNLPCMELPFGLVGPPLHREQRNRGALPIALTQLEVLGPPPPAPASISAGTGFPGWEVSPPRSTWGSTFHGKQADPSCTRLEPGAQSPRAARQPLSLFGSFGCLLNKPFLIIFHISCHLPLTRTHWRTGPEALRLSLC